MTCFKNLQRNCESIWIKSEIIRVKQNSTINRTFYQIRKWMSPACSKGPEISRMKSWSLITWSVLRQTRAVRLDQKCCLIQNLGRKSKWSPTRRTDIRMVPGAETAKVRGWKAVLKAERKLRLTIPVKMPDKWPRKDAFGTRT